MTIVKRPFLEVFEDASKGNKKTPQREFLEHGQFPVVDQGQGLIAGYINDPDRLCKAKPPVIIFGDHTRAIKYVDFEFAMGADGTKVLKPKIESDVKYLYHALIFINLPSAGYSRHFKFLKELSIPLPPLHEQKRIAAILDAADALRAKRRESIVQLDALLQSEFLEIFGDLVINPMEWNEMSFGDCVSNSFRNGLSPSTKGTFSGEVLTLSAITGSQFEFCKKKPAMFEKPPTLSQRLAKNTFLICRGNGNKNLVGVGKFPDREADTVCFPDTIIGATIDSNKLTPAYLEKLWESRKVRDQIEKGTRTTNGTHKVNQKLLSSVSIPVPPIALQHRFAAIFESVEKQKARLRSHLSELDALFSSLQHRAFTGEL